MTTENTQPSVTSAQRDSYMAALAVAERFMSESSALPSSFAVEVGYWAPTDPQIRFYFHHNLTGMRQFRDEQELTEFREDREDGGAYFEATGVTGRGVRVAAWTLLDADELKSVAA